MELGGPSGEEDQWVHWEDIIDCLPDPNSDETDSCYGEDNLRTDNVRNYLEFVLQEMYELVQHCELDMDRLPRATRIPQRTSIMRGPMWIHWVLTNPNPKTCEEQFRMSPTTFCRLCNTLKNNHLLKSSRYVKITEQVATFLLIVCQGHTMRVVADRLQRSLETVHKYCHQTCRAICKLGKTIIQPTYKDTPHPYVSSNGKFYPWFGNCIGAIDGTQIDTVVNGTSNVPYISRKKKATQNVMCVVDMDLCFTYVYAGWEGSAHDSRIFSECINDPAVRFPAPADGYFYLVDSGYGCYMGFMPPYRNERYHLTSFRGRQGGPRGKLETFKYRHSSLRSIVERAFGIIKRRFRILERMNPYAIDFQRLIIVVCCAIHNFIRKDCGESDELFKEALHQMYGEEWVNLSRCDHLPFAQTVIPGHRPDRSAGSKRHMELYRSAICESIWNSMHKD